MTETSVRYFGPATRSHYDPSSWALSVAGTTAHEIVPDLEASARVIAEDQPAFMKPLPSGDYLPAVITILHAIPAAREALLFRDHVSASYGYDPGWWNGTPILTSEVVADNAASNEDQGLQLIHETQRLMALLDQTNRSYGSVEALSKLEFVGDSHPEAKTLVDKFLVGWESAASRLSQSENITTLFRSTALRTSPDESEMSRFWCFENILESDSRTSRTLYDAMDDAIWALDPLGNNNENTSIEQVAKVFVMRLIQQDANSTGLCVQIPSSWYVDRYLPENANAAKAMRVEMAKFKAQIAQIEAEEAKLRTFRHANTGKDFDVATLLRVVISHFTKAAESGEETGVDADRLAEQLKLVQEHIATKLQGDLSSRAHTSSLTDRKPWRLRNQKSSRRARRLVTSSSGRLLLQLRGTSTIFEACQQSLISHMFCATKRISVKIRHGIGSGGDWNTRTSRGSRKQ